MIDLSNYETVKLEDILETQNAIATALTYLDDEQEKVAKQVTNLTEMKRYFLNRIMV